MDADSRERGEGEGERLSGLGEKCRMGSGVEGSGAQLDPLPS